MQVVVTGAAGLIGRHVLDQLSDVGGIRIHAIDLPKAVMRSGLLHSYNDKNVRWLMLDLRNAELTESMLAEIKPEVVIHLAGMLGVQNTEARSDLCNLINRRMAIDLAAMCGKLGVRRFMLASSSEVYGGSELPLTEDDPANGMNVYAQAKYAAEVGLRAACAEFDPMSYTIFRFFNTYGPGQVAQFFLPRVLTSIYYRLPIVINSGGRQKRSYTHALDAARLVAMAVTRLEASRNQVFNVGSFASPCKLTELADFAMEVCGRRTQVITVPFSQADRTEQREVMNRFPDLSKIKNVFGFSSLISLEDGLYDTYKIGMPMFADWVF
jgi:nucleoside-diphosphate-sugar epimerase